MLKAYKVLILMVSCFFCVLVFIFSQPTNETLSTIQNKNQNVTDPINHKLIDYNNSEWPCDLRIYYTNITKVYCHSNGILYNFKNNSVKTPLIDKLHSLPIIDDGKLLWNGYNNYRFENDSEFISLGHLISNQIVNTSPLDTNTNNGGSIKYAVEDFNTSYHVLIPGKHEYIIRPDLENFTLNDINSYRLQYGLNPLILGSAITPHLYAEELLQENCIHHIDSKGRDPLSRYKNNADNIYEVSENVAYEVATGFDTKYQIHDLDYQMMYNDSSENWGHKENILDPNTTSVSIGIASGSAVVLVEDFETKIPDGFGYNNNEFQYTLPDHRYCWK